MPGDVFIKLLLSGELTYFMNVPMFKDEIDFFTRNQEAYDYNENHVSSNDPTTNLILLSPSFFTFIFYRIVEYLKARKKQKMEMKAGKQDQVHVKTQVDINVTQKFSFESLNNIEYDDNQINHIFLTKYQKISQHQNRNSHWNYEEWEQEDENQLFLEPKLHNTFKEIKTKTTNKIEIEKSLQRASEMESNFESHERTSLLVNTKWF